MGKVLSFPKQRRFFLTTK